MKLVAIIPARGGSKGIPKKNIAPCAGRPLLHWTVQAALKSGVFADVLISTDDEEILRIARLEGASASGLRPSALAGDETPMLPVIRYETETYEAARGRVEGVVLLQPTSPMRNDRHIREAIKIFSDSKADTVVSVVLVPHQFSPASLMWAHPETGELTKYLDHEAEVLRRQDKPILFARNGPAILILGRDQVVKESFYSGKTIGYPMSAEDSVDVDSPHDLEFADLILRKRSEIRGRDD